MMNRKYPWTYNTEVAEGFYNFPEFERDPSFIH